MCPRASRAKCITGCRKHSVSRRGDCPAVFGVCAVSPAVLSALLGLTILKGWEVFKRIQRRATKVVKVVEGKSCEEQLRTLSLSNLEKRKLRCNYIALFSFLRGGSGEGGTELTELFYLGTSDTTHGNIHIFKSCTRKVSD